MDSLSIGAGVIAVGQAGDRLERVFAHIKFQPAAPQEIDTPVTEVDYMKIALKTMQGGSIKLSISRPPGMSRMFEACMANTLELEG
jgi:hypothetical protein